MSLMSLRLTPPHRLSTAALALTLVAAGGCSKSQSAKPAPAAATPAAGAAAAPAAPAAAAPSAKAPDKTPTPKMRPPGALGGVVADWAALKTQVAAQPASNAPKVPLQQRRDARRAAAHAPTTGAALASGFRLSYAPTGDAVQLAFQRAFQQERVLESVVAQLNASLRIRGVIDIELAGCDEANAFYDDGEGGDEDGNADETDNEAGAGESDDEGVDEAAKTKPKGGATGAATRGPRITICYELITEFLDLFDDKTQDTASLRAEVVGAVYFTLFHELGHALTDNFKLAVVGREEDAVDQLATLLLLRMGEPGIAAAFAAANAFALEQAQEDDSEEGPDLWDEHSMSGQRMYDMLCLIYGSNPDAFEDMVGDDGVPEERAEQCPQSYAQILSAWDRLLGPHLAKTSTLKVVLPPIEAVSAATSAPAPAAAAAPAPAALK